MGNRKSAPRLSATEEEYAQWEHWIYHWAHDEADARAQPMTGAELRSRTDPFGVTYPVIARWLGLTPDR
jgi:hypothetical protein